MPFTIIPREEWNAKTYRDHEYLDHPVTNILVTNTNTKRVYVVEQGMAAMRMLQNSNMYQKMRDIKYSFVIGDDGYVYEGRGWMAQSGLAKRHSSLNSSSLFLAFFWNSEDGDPPDGMYETLDNLIKLGIRSTFIAPKCLIHHIPPE